MRTMDFAKNISTNKNQFNTVRRGMKWSNLLIGENLKITTPTTMEQAEVKNIRILKFEDLNDDDLINNFDKTDGRSVNTLYKSMKTLYNGFDKREVVILVDLELI